MPIHSDPAVIEAVARHSAREAAQVHLKMKCGLSSLASIAATAPFVGLFGTVAGIVDSFHVETGPNFSAYFARAISQSLFSSALGLLVAIACGPAFSKAPSRSG